jgi:4-amino-4-deoxy-L-arabinose transferase-like glycosyltransferase
MILVTDTSRRLRRADYLLLTLLAAALFGYCTISGKPLTMHEARLPQNAREMLATGEWLLPRSGERPWLERPPFPHWAMLAAGHLAGRLDQVWIVRIPPSTMGWLTLLLAGWTGARLMGRQKGLLAAVALATMYEFCFYAGQAEDDIFLAFLVALAVACFVAAEFPSTNLPDDRTHFLGNRPPAVWGFFAAAGLTSLAKGPLIGAIEVVVAAVAFLVLARDKLRIRRYVWLWGWLIFAVLSVAWYAYAYGVYPSIWDNLRFDFAGSGRTEPLWYYAVAILWTTAPWTPLWILGLWLTWRGARTDRAGPSRFLWCWWLAPLVALSLPARKHHHYLVAVLPAFAMLVGVGLEHVGQWISRAKARPHMVVWGVCFVAAPGAAAITLLAWWDTLPGPLWSSLLLAAAFSACAIAVSAGLARRSGRGVLVPLLVGVTVFAAWGQSILATSGRNRNLDFEFLARVRQVAAPDKPLMVDARGSLEFFRQQFYLPPGSVPLQDLTFLRDERITAPQVYVLTRLRCGDSLSAFGSWQVVEESRQIPAGGGLQDRYTLFLLTFAPGLERYPAPAVSVTQAMGRAPGPFCGPPLKADGNGEPREPAP